ncbi:MAG TPA: porphobilinogen synthase [Fimbriimonadaceae bacterium]|jgi:porphobilinogen synthase
MNHNNLRRLRRTPQLREIFEETRLNASEWIYPIFVKEGAAEKESINSMPGQFRHSLESLKSLSDEIAEAGVKSVLLFGLPSSKDEAATSSRAENGIVQQAIRQLKKQNPDLVVMTDVCVCAYTPHGHCGVVKGEAIDNDATLPLLAEMAVSHAQSGADIVAPSSMMDGQVAALRCALNRSGLLDTAIMGYSIKYSGPFYGPFRDAADSSPSFGDRSSYQHSSANPRHSMRELKEDIEEGADLVMVKPGLSYLDVIYRARQATDLPLAVYSVSGEYSMIKAAAERGWIDEKAAALETLRAFKRAGADLVITYFAVQACQWIKSQS